MTHAQHTKGKWHCNLNECGKIVVRESNTSHVVCKIETGSEACREITGGDAEADGLLLAAAPELYEALSFWLPHIEGHFEGKSDEFDKMLEAAHTIIAKAKGEA
jgi:hypothetical protein